ncbi:MAG: MobF family relaxase [Aquihabitans sp.]
MGLHKLTAGDGYTYLTRQVAAHDATEKGHQGLGEYYDERGESPGCWVGSGLAGLQMQRGQAVTAEQMKALFGQGRHPDAVTREAAAIAQGATRGAAAAAGALGRPFNVYEAASVFNTRVARAFTDYNRDRDLAWNTAIPVEMRARIRTEVGTVMFTDQHGRSPEDARELSGFVARSSRHATCAVAGYDLTFSPVKSVSTLWALAPREVADQVRAAHQAAVEDTIRWLEREAVFTRVGRGGARQVATRGLVAAMFTHRDTRAGDPDLHTHVAISNKVQALAHPGETSHGQDAGVGGGQWLALDGRLVYQANVAASERYNTRLEAELTARLGLGFHDTTTSAGKRPVREIDGINHLLIGWWSRRRRDIEARRSVLAAEFQTRHGRPPTAVEAIALAQQATLETRAAKHAPRSENTQRASWRHEAEEALGGALEVEEMLTKALTRRHRTTRPDQAWCRDAAQATVRAMEASRATWQVWHLRAEAERQARTAGIALVDLDHTVDQVVDGARTLSTRLGVSDPIAEPPPLRRADGSSVYEVHGSTRFTSTRILAAEEELLALARTTGGPRISDVRVGIALAESAANGLELNDAQAAMVESLATSGSLLALALAPAGTGKTTTMAVLSRAWASSGVPVLGLAPSAQAAHELGRALDNANGGHTDTLTKLSWTLAKAPRDQWPAWVEAIGPRTLVIIDEAGQASTTELAAAVAFITGRGGAVRLIGDDQQLASVGAGGVLRDITHTVGAATLSEVRRFTDHAEAAATLAVREGDPSALGFYADHRRIHVGDIGAVTDQAYDAWAADRAAGLDSILLAPTRDLVTRLNARARTDRLATLPQPGGGGRQVRLGDGNNASAGDVIVTKRNHRRLAITPTDWVKNGDRWTITTVHPDQGLTARHLELGCSIRLPGEYVAEHVRLGYAATVHAAQGMTTDTSHTVVSGEEPRQLLYVALSRGRHGNHLYLANSYDGDPHTLIHPEALRPPTALDVLTTILGRDGSQRSATTTKRELATPATQLQGSALRYHDAVEYAASEILGLEQLNALDAQVEALWPGLTGEPAYPTLRGHLALHTLEGTDPLTLLLEATQSRELGSSTDRAAVLQWRLGGHRPGPLPWLQGIPHQLAAHPIWGGYLSARADRVEALAAAVHTQSGSWSPSETPPWAADLTASRHAQLRSDLAVWRAVFGVPETDHRPTGPRQEGADAGTYQHQLGRRLRATTRHDIAAATPLRDSLPHGVQTDPGCARLLERMRALTEAGIDVASLLTQALAAPRPLPEEHTADALWWRLVGHLGPAALRATGRPGVTLRPPWTPALIARLGHEDAERVMADSAWPALVAAIHHRPEEWTAEQLIDAVTHGPRPDVPVEELCSALLWRVATMTDPPQEPEGLSDPHDLAPTELLISTVELAHTTPRPTSVERIHELNQIALDHYTDMYPRSWAPAYLRERLGSDLDADSPFTPGYAPPGPGSLIHHLTQHGASEGELIDAGLARRTDRGVLVDVFRDRLVFPIYAGSDLVGFVARRNPTKDDSAYAGPKYLNTRTTSAFTKGELLFGLSEGTHALNAGATPVLVEGPLDAIAVTLAGQGRTPQSPGAFTVGIAPLGTAFTDAQAAHLKALLREDPSRLVIATDADPAGWVAAQRAFWRLAALGVAPRHLDLPAGLDPADLLRTHGQQTLAHMLNGVPALGTRMLESMVTGTDLTDTAARLWLARDAARVIAAMPPPEWTNHINRLNRQLDLPPGMLNLDVIDAAETWDHDQHREAEHQLRQIAAQPLGPTPSRRSAAGQHAIAASAPTPARNADREAESFRREPTVHPSPRR